MKKALLIFLLISQSVFGQMTIKGVVPKGININFDPKVVPGMMLWLDAGRDGAFTADTSAGTNTVSVWKDFSGNGYNFTNSTKANQPSILSNAVNGRIVVGFRNTGQLFLDGPAALAQRISGNGHGFSIFAVWSADAVSTTQAYIDFGNSTNTGPHLIFEPLVLSTTWRLSRTDDAGVSQTRSQAGVDAINYHITGAICVTTNVITVTEALSYTLQALTNTVTTLNQPCLGANHEGAPHNNFWNGKLAELIGYDNGVSSNNTTLVMKYLKQKYNL